MVRKKSKCIRIISLLLSALMISAAFPFAVSVPVSAAEERIIELTNMAEYVYADSVNNRLFVLNGDAIELYDLRTGTHNAFWNFKTDSGIDTSTYQRIDFFGVENRLYFLFQAGGKSYVSVMDFTRLSATKNSFQFNCKKVMGTNKKEIFVSANTGRDKVFFVRPDKTMGNSDVSVSIEKFIGKPDDSHVFFISSNGATTADYDNNSFKPTGKKLQGVAADVDDHITPVEILENSYLADYKGNVFTINGGSVTKLFSFDRSDYDGSDGFGCLTVKVPSTNYFVGRGKSGKLEVFDTEQNKIIASTLTAFEIEGLTLRGSDVVCIERGNGKVYAETFSLQDLITIDVESINLNELSVYAGRTSSDVYNSFYDVINDYDMKQEMLSDKGSVTSPYKQSVMSNEAEQALLRFSNYQRWLAGLTPYTQGGAQSKEYASKGAILLAASTETGHYPPKPADMDQSFYNAAYIGTGGNLSYGLDGDIAGGITSIRELTNDTNNASNSESYTEDGRYFQGYNTPGHRNTFLQRGGSLIAYGASDKILVQYCEHSQSDPNQSGNFEDGKNNQTAYAWPSPGAFPVEEIDTSAVWTIYLNTDVVNTSSKNLEITITDLDSGEKFVRNTVMHDRDGQREGYSLCSYGGKSVSFTPPKADSFEGKKYQVHIANLQNADNLPAEITYTINMFTYTDYFKPLVKLSSDKVNLFVGQSQKIDVDLKSMDINDSYSWITEDYKIARASRDNYISGIRPGTVTVSAVSDSGASADCSVTVVGDMTKTDLRLEYSETVYDGTEKKPETVPYYNGNPLTEDSRYTVTYADNVNAGTATVNVNLSLNNSKTSSQFTIKPAPVSSFEIKAKQSMAHTGSPLKNIESVSFNGKVLTEGVDYSLEYKNNTNPGTADVIITGKGNFSGSRTEHFSITAKSIENLEIKLENTVCSFTSPAVEPEVIITDGSNALEPGKDFETVYANNDKIGSASVTINGIGAYGGSVRKSFMIVAQNISNSEISVAAGPFVYNGEEQKPAISVTDGTVLLTEGKDYTLTYSNNTEAGEAKITVTGMGNFTGSVEKSFTVIPMTLTDSDLKIESVEDESGMHIKATVSVGGRLLAEGTDYTLDYPDRETVTANGTGNYTGTATQTLGSSSVLIGDVNLDGNVTIDDATAIQKYLASMITLTDEMMAAADVNGSGTITIDDATIIQKYLAQMIDSLG